MMDPEVKAKWVAALRSGKYEQGRNALRRMDDSRCCLGVLWDSLGREWILDANPEHWCVLPGYSGALPHAVLEEIGMTPNEQSNLSSLNDGAEWSFARIADWIEENL